MSHLNRPIALTRAGLVAERVTRSFWPVWTILFLALAPLMMGWHDLLPLEAFWALAVLAVVSLGVALWRGWSGFRWPSAEEARARVDATLPGRPLTALADAQAVGAADAGSAGVWRVHLERMRERSRAARAVEPDLRVSRLDRYGLRYMALIAFVAALLFGSVWRVGSVADMAPGAGDPVLATGPVWEGWAEPPGYTGKPTLYLNDIPAGPLSLPEGSEITLRLYGDAGALRVTQSVAPVSPVAAPADADGGAEDETAALDPGERPEQRFAVASSGRIAVEGPGGRAWEVTVIPDAAPVVEILGEVEVEALGEMSQRFRAEDDHGVTGGRAVVTLDLGAVDRRFGLAAEPQEREPIVVDLPMPFAGDRGAFEEAMIDDFSQHPWANLPVVLTMEVEDAPGQTGVSEPREMVLPGRRFFQPVARAVIEVRRDLLWSKGNAQRSADLLKAIAHRPEDRLIRSETSYLRLRVITRRLDAMARFGMDDEGQEEIASALWDLAIQLEDGTLADARERLRRAQERLSEAMRNGASDEEIAELMQELREAVDDYTRMLAQQSDPSGDGTDQPQTAEGESFEFSQDELQALMDRIQELMEEGRMAEAQELMEQLNQLMENMQVTQGEGGQGQQSPGQQSMQDLSETLRDQQGLSDEAFRDLQEQFGQGQPQQGQPGQQGQGQQGQQNGQNQQPGQGSPGEGQEGGPGGEQSLADRQRALRQELERQRSELPNLGGEAADGARESLDRADRAMDGAEDALREGDMAEAIDRQSEAMDALREGIRSLGQALAENQQDGQPGQGQADGSQTGRVEPMRRDPLGRQLGESGQFGTEENMLQGEDVYRRAEELLDELRRRSSEQERPEEELDYLRRLLKRF
ncbi:TIGR02302 family protein [Histidinibacterium lentulum]|uniref:TIGR02302 family protein n=1 Tax=Histidinibacterium lentulum TaxID=2480588 RepID=A0A3N2R5P4_9RHOB|nr:TIGR02302 family protein [Histidinibacterium lentulum]ROU02805.1 TIGR02302 family protein [Histidinibacterium lentulum]